MLPNINIWNLYFVYGALSPTSVLLIIFYVFKHVYVNLKVTCLPVFMNLLNVSN